MRRRAFLLSAAAPLLPRALDAQPAKPRRTSRAVSRLRMVSRERREALARNPDNISPWELNSRIPEIDEIELLNSASGARAKKTLRLVAWNTERGRYWREGARLIQEHPALRDPDVVFLGEMDLGMARSHNHHTTREMAAALKMNYAYGVEFLEFTKGEKEEREQYPGENEWGYHGNAILSRYPLSDLRMLRFPGIEKWYGDYQKRLGGRMALFATIRLERPVTLVSTHLESSEQDSAARHSQTGMILDELRAHAAGTPVLLGGDLNAPPEEPAMASLRKAGFLVEESNEMSAGTVQRVVDGKFVLAARRLDYVCVRGVKVVRDETSPKVVAAWLDRPEGPLLLADHAVVAVQVEIP